MIIPIATLKCLQIEGTKCGHVLLNRITRSVSKCDKFGSLVAKCVTEATVETPRIAKLRYASYHLADGLSFPDGLCLPDGVYFPFQFFPNGMYLEESTIDFFGIISSDFWDAWNKHRAELEYYEIEPFKRGEEWLVFVKRIAQDKNSYTLPVLNEEKKELYKQECRVRELGWDSTPTEIQECDGETMFCFQSREKRYGVKTTDFVYAKTLLQALQQIDYRPF